MACYKCALDIGDAEDNFSCDGCTERYHLKCDSVLKKDWSARNSSKRLKLYCEACSSSLDFLTLDNVKMVLGIVRNIEHGLQSNENKYDSEFVSLNTKFDLLLGRFDRELIKIDGAFSCLSSKMDSLEDTFSRTLNGEIFSPFVSACTSPNNLLSRNSDFDVGVNQCQLEAPKAIGERLIPEITFSPPSPPVNIVTVTEPSDRVLDVDVLAQPTGNLSSITQQQSATEFLRLCNKKLKRKKKKKKKANKKKPNAAILPSTVLPADSASSVNNAGVSASSVIEPGLSNPAHSVNSQFQSSEVSLLSGTLTAFTPGLNEELNATTRAQPKAALRAQPNASRASPKKRSLIKAKDLKNALKAVAPIIGAGSSSMSGLAQCRPKKCLFVGMLDASTSCEAISKHLVRHSGVPSADLQIHRMAKMAQNNEYIRYVSFKIWCSETTLKAALCIQPSLWPEGAIVREFIHFSKNGRTAAN